MELYLVRHGQSADAVEGEDFELIEGHGNPPLSDIGREQAELVGARLAHLQFEALYVTTLRRTVETAAPLIRRTGLVPVVEPDLREVNLGEWEGVAGQPAKMVGTITYDSMATFDIRQTDSAVAYIKQHANGGKPFFMDINFIKMHNPTNAAP